MGLTKYFCGGSKNNHIDAFASLKTALPLHGNTTTLVASCSPPHHSSTPWSYICQNARITVLNQLPDCVMGLLIGGRDDDGWFGSAFHSFISPKEILMTSKPSPSPLADHPQKGRLGWAFML